MAHSSASNAPTTVGELRRALEKLGSPWMADPRFSDDEPIPDRPRGGQADTDVPAQHRITPLDPSIDVKTVIADRAPTNPFLLNLWIEAGLCGKARAVPVPTSADDQQWGAS
jgi:hypothetical protein